METLPIILRPVPDAKHHPTKKGSTPEDKNFNHPLPFSPTLLLLFLPFPILYHVHLLISLHSFHRLLASLTKSLLSIYMHSPAIHLDFSHPTN